MKKYPGLGWCYGAIVLAAGFVAGCSGGGGGGTTPATSSLPVPAPVPAGTTFRQSATAIITFPHGTPLPSKRSYVSPNSTSISVTVNAVNGLPPPTWVPKQVVANLSFSGAGQNCTTSNGLATCAITIPAPPGNVNYQIATYAIIPTPTPAPSTTPAPEGPTVLDEAEETIAIAQGKANQVSVALKGVVKFAIVTPASPLLPGQSSSTVLNLTAMDASGAVITGTQPFVGPFTLQDADKYAPPSGPKNTPDPLYAYSTELSVNGGTPSKIVQVFSPLDVITLSDGGVSQGQFQIKAAGPGQLGSGPVQGTSVITPELAPIVLPNVPLDDAAHGGLPTDPNYNQYTVFLHVGDPPFSITPSEVGWTTPAPPYGICSGLNFEYNCLPVANVSNIYTPCNDASSPVAVFNPGPPAGNIAGYKYTITAKQPGLCLQQFFDGLYPAHEPAPIGNPLVNGEIWVSVQ